MVLGCSSVKLSDVPQKPLPPSPPALNELPLELPPEGGPRRPIDVPAPSALRGDVPHIVLIEEDRSALRALAEQDSRVQEVLGKRFGYIETEEVSKDHCRLSDEEKGTNSAHITERSSTQHLAHRLTYYSYSHNSTVYVCLKDNQIISVQRDPRENYQPPEGEQEVEQAITLARKDPRIAGDVQNLFGHAILTSPEEYRYFWVNDEAGFGNRVFWVTFSEEPESLALFFARVDLTTGQVLEAGKEPGLQ